MAGPDVPRLLEPPPEPPNGRGPQKLADHQLDAIARMYVSGASMGMISGATGVSTNRIKTAMSTYGAERLEFTKGQVLRATATHYFELLGMLDEVRVNIRGGLHSADERIRLETSKWLHDTLIPKPTQRTDTENRLSVSPELGDAITSIAESVASLVNANLNIRDLPIRTGPNALHRPMDDVEHS